MSWLRRILFFVAMFSCCLTAIFGFHRQAMAIDLPKDIQSALNAWIADKPGGIVLAYIEGNKVTFFHAGHFSATDPRPVDADTFFEIGSVTKVFTALLLADSVRTGKIMLDAPIGAPFPASGITYRQLATHTSGLPRLPNGMSLQVNSDAFVGNFNPYREQTLEKLKNSFDAAKSSAKESPFAYSNFGYAVLGQAIAGAYNEPFEQLMAEKILQPAGLMETKLSWREADPQRLAPGHSKYGRPAENWDQAAFAPAGALVSTARDLAKLIKLCVNSAPSSLRDSLNEIAKPLVDVPKLRAKAGLGWIITTKEGQTIFWHNGGTGGYCSFVGFDSAKKIGVAVITNHAQPVDHLAFAVLRGELKTGENSVR